jgi:hypothetical protein
VLDNRQFVSQFFGLGYDIQLGWASVGLKANGLDCPQVTVIAVESTVPYSVVVYRVPAHIIDNGAERAVKLAREYHCCEVAGHWPGICEGVQTLELPAWAGGAETAVDDSGIEEVQP